MALSLGPPLAPFSVKPNPVRPLPFVPPPQTLRVSTSRSVPVAAAASSKSVTAATGKRTPKGIATPRPVSPELQAFLGGVAEIPRTEVLKAVWAYIKQNNLQDPDNKKIIVCDEKLKKIFSGKDRVGFLEVAGLIGHHFPKKAEA